MPDNHSQLSLSKLFMVYVGLMLLLGLTTLAATFPLGAAALLIALAIAAAKAILVILYFMHVRFASRVTWVFVVAGFLWLSILFALTFAEYIGRTRWSRVEPPAGLSEMAPAVPREPL